MATSAIVPIDGILLVKLDCCCEISDSLIVFQEPVPDETTTVVSWCVFRVKLDDLVEVLECKVQAITTNFFPHCAQMMDSLYICRLELNGLQVVCFCLGKMISLIPAEGSIVVCFKVATVELDRPRVVCDSCVEVALLSIGEASIVIEVSLTRLNLNR